jgi:hypothetical protein
VAPVGMIEDAIVVPRAGGRGEFMVQGALRHSTLMLWLVSLFVCVSSFPSASAPVSISRGIQLLPTAGGE